SSSVMATLWLLLALSPVCGLLTSLSPVCGLLTSLRGEAPPLQKLRMEPNERRLTWERLVPGPRAACRKNMGTPVWEEEGLDRCTFTSLSLCHVTNYSVYFPSSPGPAAWILFPESDPARPAAATNLHCNVHDLVQMSCRWGRGPGAPLDVQYRMFWRSASLGRDQDCECLHYDVTDRQGAQLGCRVDNVTGSGTLLMVTVTGHSGLSTVGCSDASVDLQRHETLTPPTLTAACNGSSEAHVRWDMRSHFSHKFDFQLQINKSSHLEPEMEKAQEPYYRVPNPGSVSFRVRARPQDSTVPFSTWSDTVRLGKEIGTGYPKSEENYSLPGSSSIAVRQFKPSRLEHEA
ncbi:hypothetical protein STEG23_032549, partial [Scotinomys teguina]